MPLTFLDRLRFSKLLTITRNRVQEQARKKNQKTTGRLVKQQLGSPTVDPSTIVNLAGIELSDTEKEVLSRGLKFGIPPSSIKREEISAEFELCWQQLEQLTPQSAAKGTECKAALLDLSEKFASTKIDRTGFPLQSNHLKAIGQLKKNKNLVVTRPDKGNGVVLLNHDDYIRKMETILSDTRKFEKIGTADTHDRTLQHERALQAFLLRAVNKKDLPRSIYDRIRPVGSTRPRAYGVPKIHKEGAPLRPILSMVNSPQHEMAKWLAEVLKPVVTHYSQHTVDDTFQFCNELEQFSNAGGHANTFMCSFDVVSLFTNVPLAETIQICLDSLYRNSSITAPSIPEHLLEKLLYKATTEVEFSFNNNMYKQVDGVAMGSPLGPVLANIFVGYCETKIQSQQTWPLLYKRFVDDTYSIFNGEGEAQGFFKVLNDIHPSLRFTMESERENKLPFLDVLTHRVNDTYIRSVYRKPTFTGLYTRWDSFSDTRHKINLVKSLTSRALKICSSSTVDDELKKLKDIFTLNGYPADVVSSTINKILASDASTESKEASTEDQATGSKRVFLRLPWIGRISSQFRRTITNTVNRSYPSALMRIIFSTRHAFPGRPKDILPAATKSSVIYHFACSCKLTYVGRTTQILSERIKQHAPPTLFSTTPVPSLNMDKNDSAITRHLKGSPRCIKALRNSGPDERFQVLAQARNNHHLDILEAIYIKTLSPPLCQQKGHVKCLHLVR